MAQNVGKPQDRSGLLLVFQNLYHFCVSDTARGKQDRLALRQAAVQADD